MAQISIAGDTSGSVSLVAPAVSGTTTLTLPTANGTLVTTASGQTLASPTISGVSTFAAGTAAAPAITTTGDTNTGMFFPAADTIAFAEGGTEVMRIDSSGYVTKPYQPAFSVNGTGSGNKTAGTVLGFTDAAGASTQITYNISGSWSNANNRFTAPVAGIYLFNTAIYVQNSTTAIQSIAPRLNGAQISGLSDTFILFSGLVAAGNTDNQVRGTFTIKLAAGDYVDIAVRSGAQTLAYYGGHSFFQGYLLG
jgi:hypothetical protein